MIICHRYPKLSINTSFSPPQMIYISLLTHTPFSISGCTLISIWDLFDAPAFILPTTLIPYFSVSCLKKTSSLFKMSPQHNVPAPVLAASPGYGCIVMWNDFDLAGSVRRGTSKDVNPLTTGRDLDVFVIARPSALSQPIPSTGRDEMIIKNYEKKKQETIFDSFVNSPFVPNSCSPLFNFFWTARLKSSSRYISNLIDRPEIRHQSL